MSLINKSKIDSIIGIDPGLSGAISTYRNNQTESINMPRTIQELNEQFKQLRSESEHPICFLEKVQLFDTDNNRGKQFRIQKMLQQFRDLENCLILNNIPYIEVHPIKWQNKLNLRIKGEEKPERKKRYKEIAQTYHPEIKVTLKKCDSLLILRFGRVMLSNDINWINENLKS